MNSLINLIGAYAMTGQRAFARELLASSPLSVGELQDYRAERPNIADLDLVEVAAVYVRSTTRT